MSLPLNQIILGDAIEQMKALPDNSIDALISDPPYAKTNLAWDKAVDWAAFWLEAKRVLQPKGSVVMTAAQPFTTDLISSNRKWFKYCLVWDKGCASNFAACKHRPLTYHEDIVVFAPGSNLFIPQMKWVGKPSRPTGKAPHRGSHVFPSHVIRPPDRASCDRYPQSIIRINSRSAECNNNTKRLHPTQKPIELFKYLILSYTHPGMTVLDPFSGSGSTAIACIETGRNFIGIEKDPTYHALSLQRIARTQEVPIAA